MTTAYDIEKDFNDHMNSLKKGGGSTKLIRHHGRAGVVGSLTFIISVAEQNDMSALTERLLRQANLAKQHVKQSFDVAWTYKGRRQKNRNLAFTSDMVAGFNAAREAYAKKYASLKLPDKMKPGEPSFLKPRVKKVIDELVLELSKVD
ncbi:MAG: hypothetical protein AAGA15_01050 [Pseudomonadota bacterium]